MESDKLECPICCNTYDLAEHEPYLGDCGHSLCKICCYNLKHTMEATHCPYCKMHKAFEDPPKNHTAIEILGFLHRADIEMKALNETKDYFSNQKNHGEEYSNCSIFMKNIPRTWNFDNIRSYFYSYGMIRDIVFGNTHNSNNGMATVVYSSPEEADRAIKDMNRRIIDGVPISVTFEKNSKKFQGSERIQALAKVAANKNEQTKRNNSLTIEITNLPTVTETDLRAVFGRDGSIRQVTINKDRFGRQTGVARIRFENSSGVENALKRSFQHVFGLTGPKIIVERVTSTLPMKF